MYWFFITSPSQLAICTPSVTTTSFLIATSALCRLLLWVKVLDCGIYTRDGAPLSKGRGGKKGWAVHKDFYCIFVSECVSCTLYFKTVCFFLKKGGQGGLIGALDFVILPSHQVFVFILRAGFSCACVPCDILLCFYFCSLLFADFVFRGCATFY